MMTTHDRAEIIRALSVFLQPGQVTELRALDASQPPDRWVSTWSGYFDDPQRLADAVLPLTARGVYFVPNEINPDLLARAANRARAVKKDPTTADADIIRRRWLLVDCDPIRAAGISSSAVEHEQAIERAAEIQGWLESQGWPAPALADSGNGGHVLARVDLPADDGGLIERCLNALAARFNDDAVKVDTSVHNSARIWKLYGTRASKGDNTPGRPHRLARLIELPAVGVVTWEQLTALGGTAPQAGRAPAALPRVGAGQPLPLDVERWAAVHGLELPAARDWQGGKKWVLPVCPMNPAHTDRSAFVIQMASGALSAGCQHESCKGWGWAELRAKYEPARVAAFAPPARVLTDADAPPAGGDSIDAPMPTPATHTHRNGTHPPEEDHADARPTYWADVGRAGTPMLRWSKPTSEGTIPVTLAHFTARVVGERVRHKADGTIVRVITVEVKTGRDTVLWDMQPEDFADARRFHAACLHAVGADARLMNGSAVKHLPLAAFELADPERSRAELYEFVGWHEQAGRLVFLSAGGTIGASQTLAVDLANLADGVGESGLVRFGPRDDGDAAFAAGLLALAGSVRKCAPDLVSLPGLAAVFLAPLLRWSPARDRPALHYIGTTGARKSAFCDLLQAFFGLTRYALSWAGTPISIEIALSVLRDCLVVLDDLKKSTSDRDAGIRVIQSYADRRGRSRATRNGELAKARFAGGLLVSNGEDIPSGEASIAARSLFVPVGKTDIDTELLTTAQELAPNLATVMARYITWLIERQNEMPRVLAEVFLQARARYRDHLKGRGGINDAGRVAVSCALLEAGATVGVSWLQSQGWPAGQATEWILATREALQSLALGQQDAIFQESAARAFLSGLRALIDARRLELYTVPDGAKPPALSGISPTSPGAVVCGWRVGDEVWLQPDLTLAEVQRWLDSQKKTLPTERGLYAQLRDGGYLVDHSDGQKTTVVKWIAGHAKRVLALQAAVVDSAEDEKRLAEDEKKLAEAPLHV